MNHFTLPTPASGPSRSQSAVSDIQNFNTTRHTARSSEQYPKAMLGATTQKPSVTRRVTGIFSTKHPTRSASETSANSPPEISGASTPQLDPPSEPTSVSIAEKTSSTDVVVTTPTEGRAVTNHASIHRYIILPDVPGGHEHRLKSVKRQEKLWNLFGNIISGKSRNIQEHSEMQLSIVVSWADHCKPEPVSLVSGKETGPTSTATLEQKYGECKDIVGQGAFGIVRVTHKRVGNGARE